VTPPEGEAEAATGAQPSGRVESQINSLEKDIAEQKRLLELRNQELADLQKKLADSRAQEEVAKLAPAPAPEPAPAAPAEPGSETAVAPEDDVGKTTAPAPAEVKPKPV
jgi:pilus assembly protein FimV